MPQHMAFGDPKGVPRLQLDRVVRMEHFAEDAAALCEAINAHSGLGLPCTVDAHIHASPTAVNLTAWYTGPASHCLPAVVQFYCHDFVLLNVALMVDGERFELPASMCS